MTAYVVRPLPSARASRSLLTTFSTSMMASSTTTPMATTSPASTITLSVTSWASRTRIAAINDSGMASRLMKAVRHSNRNAMMITTTSRMPISIASVRLSMDCSMNVAGRKIVVSTLIPGRPGWSFSIASSTPRVTSMVLAPRYFWTISMMPRPSSITASPNSGPWSMTTSPRSSSLSTRPFRSTTGTFARSSGAKIGCTCRMLKRCPPSSTKPPVPITAPSEYRSSPASRASPVAPMTLSSETSYFRSSCGSTWTCRWGRRSPQIATWATPGTRSNRARIFQ